MIRDSLYRLYVLQQSPNKKWVKGVKMWTSLSKRPPVVLQHHASLYLHQGGFVSVGLLLKNYCTDFYRTVMQVFVMRVPLMVNQANDAGWHHQHVYSPGLPEWAKLQVWMNPKNDVHILWLFVYFWVLPFQSIIYMYKTVQSALFSSCHMSSVTTSGRRATQPPRSSTRCRSLSATTSPWRRSARSSRRRTVRSVNWNTVRRRKSCNVRLQVEMHLQTIRSRVTVVRGQKVRARQLKSSCWAQV